MGALCPVIAALGFCCYQLVDWLMVMCIRYHYWVHSELRVQSNVHVNSSHYFVWLLCSWWVSSISGRTWLIPWWRWSICSTRIVFTHCNCRR